MGWVLRLFVRTTNPEQRLVYATRMLRDLSTTAQPHAAAVAGAETKVLFSKNCVSF